MIGFTLWILIHIVPVLAIYSLGGALLYRQVYKHFYEKERVKTVITRDRWGDIIKDRNGQYVREVVSHEKAHVEALQRAAFAGAIWPFAVWPLVVFKTATPISPARKQELADLEEERKLRRDLERKQMLAKMEAELGIDSSTKMIEGSVVKKKNY